MKNLIMVVFISLVSLGVISGCSSSDDSVPVISGTAATGKGIVGTIIVKDANGTEVNTTSSTDGSYSVLVPAMVAPFIIQVVPDDGSPVLFSFATTAGQTVNVTPLTNQALSIASGNADLNAIYQTWDGTGLTEADVETAQATLLANLSAQLTAAGLDPTAVDLFGDDFDTDGTGIDGVLDILNFNIGADGVITLSDSTDSGFSFNPDIDISDFIPAGTGTSTGTGTTTGGGALAENEEAATIPASIAGTYNYTFNEISSGSGIADGTTTEFVVGTDGTLTIDGSTVLSGPVLYLGNEHEAIWFDDANDLGYALSSLVDGAREINVSSGVHFNQSGFTFYGQYNDGSAP